MTRCFLDLDGTLVDFYASALPLQGCPNLYDDPANLGRYRAQEILGISNSKFWAPIDTDPDFWISMPKTAEADEIVAFASERFGLENIAILTAPSLSPSCVPGKRRWVEKNYPALAQRIIYTAAKELCAGAGNVLIDDSDEMVDNFQEAGGVGVSVPRAWNRLYLYRGEVMRTIKNQIEEYLL